MDFRQSSGQNQHNQSVPVGSGALPGQPPRPRPLTHPNNGFSGFGNTDALGWMGILNIINLAGIALLLIALSISLMAGKKTVNQFSYVDGTKYQAVFLNSGQVYFGKVNAINSQYVDLSNVNIHKLGKKHIRRRARCHHLPEHCICYVIHRC